MKPVHEMMADKMDEADGSPDGGDDGDDYGEGLKAAMSSFIDAVHSKDAEAAAEAFENAMALCDKDKGEGEDGGSGHAALLLMPHPKG